MTALRRPDVRGRWGEITLKRLVELSGMSAHVDFTEQQYQLTDAGAIRPDMIVHMPERRDIVVDVKTPLDAYLAAVEAQSDEERARELKRHAQLVAARVRELASRVLGAVRAQPGFRGAVPAGRSVPVGGAAGESRPHRRIAQPERDARDPDQPRRAAEGGRLRLEADRARRERGGDPPARRGYVQAARACSASTSRGSANRSGASVDAFNKAVGSLEQQVMPAARRFPDLGLRVNRELEPLEPIEL